MSCKGPVIWALSLFSFVFHGTLSDTPFARAQQNNTTFMTYTDAVLGFTIRYPWNWTVNANNTLNKYFT